MMIDRMKALMIQKEELGREFVAKIEKAARKAFEMNENDIIDIEFQSAEDYYTSPFDFARVDFGDGFGKMIAVDISIPEAWSGKGSVAVLAYHCDNRPCGMDFENGIEISDILDNNDKLAEVFKQALARAQCATQEYSLTRHG